MTITRGSILVGAALLMAGASGVSAADLYGESIKDAGYVPQAAAGPSWYFRVDGGYASHDGPTLVENGIFDLTRTSYDDTWTVGGGIGTYFSRNVRGDITIDYRFESDIKGTLPDPLADLPGTRTFGLASTVVLANLYYDFDIGSRIKPYVGVGLGFVHHSTKSGIVEDDCGCTGTIESDSNFHVAGALMAGFSARLFGRTEVAGSTKDGPVYVENARNLYLDVGYRFLYLGETATGPVVADVNGTPVSRDPEVEDLHAHEFRVGLRYDFR